MRPGCVNLFLNVIKPYISNSTMLLIKMCLVVSPCFPLYAWKRKEIFQEQTTKPKPNVSSQRDKSIFTGMKSLHEESLLEEGLPIKINSRSCE